MTSTIQVTREDIKNGWRWALVRCKTLQENLERCYKCPVALAMRRVFGKRCYVESYRLHVGEREITWRCPEIVSDWTYTFDRGLPVEPFTFEVEG